jgi:hypothetical protein
MYCWSDVLKMSLITQGLNRQLHWLKNPKSVQNIKLKNSINFCFEKMAKIPRSKKKTLCTWGM